MAGIGAPDPHYRIVLAHAFQLRHIGVSKSSVNMYERDEREPGFETLEAIADFFNVNMDYLLGRESRLGADTASYEITLNAQVPEKMFSDSAKPTLLKFVEALNRSDSPDFLENVAKVRTEMDATFSATDFKHLSEVLETIHAAYKKALHLIAQSEDIAAAKAKQLAPKDTTPAPDGPETPSEGPQEGK